MKKTKHKIQKALCALLVLTMLLSITPLTVFAATTTEPILAGQTKLVQAYPIDSEDNFTYLSFTPTETALYVIYSMSDCDPALNITVDGNDVQNATYKDDIHKGDNPMDFVMECVLEEGKTYLLLIRIYEDPEAPAEDVSVAVMKACDTHTDSDHDYSCDVCRGFVLPTDMAALKLGELLLVNYHEQGIYVSFTPEEDGRYIFTSNALGGDPSATLYSENLTSLTFDGDSLDDTNFKLIYDLYANETYYLHVQNSWSDTEVTVNLCDRHEDNTLDGHCDYCEGFIEVKRTIQLWDKVSLTSNPIGTWMAFTPETSGNYILYSVEKESNDYDIWAVLYDKDWRYLGPSTDEFEDEHECYLAYEMEAGETYYFLVYTELYEVDTVSIELTLEGAKKPAKPSKGSSDDDDSAETTKNTPTGDKEPLSVGLIVAVAAGAVVLIGVGVAIGMTAKKKSKKTDE